MNLKHRLARMECLRGVGEEQRAQEARRSLDFRAMLARDHVRWCPEYRQATRADCADDEAWNDIQHTLAMAEGNFKEAKRLDALPAPRTDARRAWVDAAPSNAHKIARLLSRRAGG